MGQHKRDKDLAVLVGANIRAMREGHVWSQSDLADRIKVRASAISQFETGRVLPSISTLLDLCAAFHCPPGRLLYKHGKIVQKPPPRGRGLVR